MKNLIEQKFGMWTVIDKPIPAKHRDTKWLCRCECGTERYVSQASLLRGKSESCGCNAHLKRAKRLTIDMVGKRFGRLVVLEQVERRGNWTNAYWLCRCDCGTEKIIDGHSLRRGAVKSCGCFLRDSSRSRSTKNAKETVITRLMSSYKIGAKRRNLSFELTRYDISDLIDRECIYCGSGPSNIFKGYKVRGYHEPYLYNGIDRVDNHLGYTKENSVPCCVYCNMAKRDMTITQFEDWVMRVHARIVDRKEKP